MSNELSNKYFFRRNESQQWQDVTTLFDGIKILSITGLDDIGDSVNVYVQQWINSQKEDYMCANQDQQGNDVVIRKNVDLSLTFVAATRYSQNKNVDTQTVYNAFIDYVAKKGAFYLKSEYTHKQAYVVCQKAFKPTNIKLNRGLNSFILATIPLHTLDEPTSY